MFYNVFELKDVLSCKEEKLEKKVLLENGNSKLVAIYLEKEAIYDCHTSEGDACVLVYEGEIEIHFDAQKFNLKKGEMLMFKKEHEHKVLAKKDSKFLVVKI